MSLFQKHVYQIYQIYIKYKQIITRARKYYKLNCSILFTVRFHIVQSMPLTLQVTFVMEKVKRYQQSNDTTTRFTYFRQQYKVIRLMKNA